MDRQMFMGCALSMVGCPVIGALIFGMVEMGISSNGVSMGWLMTLLGAMVPGTVLSDTCIRCKATEAR
jgi:ribose/xylose/arabinose/galactoside ABC-type transport system permease subunit